VIFTILGFVVALLIHFIVLSSVRYNWLDNLTPQGASGMITLYLSALFG
jgi:light-harvesting complex 1 alpha chain